MKAREHDTADPGGGRAAGGATKAKAVLAETKAGAGIAAAAARGLREELDKKVTNLEKRFTLPGRAAGARLRGTPSPSVQAVPRLLPPGHRPHCPLAVQHCNPEPLPPGRHLSSLEPYIVAVDVDTMEATVIDLPRGCTSRMTASMSHRGLLLAASVDGRLKVVGSETQVISMWTMLPPIEGEPSSPPRWIRQVLIDKQDWGVHS
ncbi:hypothetical protein TRIUR3_04858 [Triticum urartu]|uniref:DUF7595 domain-containing protein n=1 Tax=Triticum urartu TaxID=4572 RepID=M8A3G9_TRIUA|nr:hypothetical protein TRIUR3_04858 [Triticum urartu]